MNNTFCKMFGEMVTSSVWLTTSKDTKLLWMTMLMIADKDGIVNTGLLGIAHQATLTYEEGVAAMEVLMAPDPLSKSTAMEGRRVIKINGGQWQIVNYIKYRDKWVGVNKKADAVTRQQLYRQRKRAGLPPAKRGRPPAAKPKTQPPTPVPLEQMPDADWDAEPQEDEDQNCINACCQE